MMVVTLMISLFIYCKYKIKKQPGNVAKPIQIKGITTFPPESYNDFLPFIIVNPEKSSNFVAGKSYTTSSPGTPPGLDRSNGTGL